MSPGRMLVIFAVCRATGCWQQECEAGITDDSQLCAIFLQQFCSAAVICLSGTIQAMTGVATTAMISRSAANCEALRNISIILAAASLAVIRVTGAGGGTHSCGNVRSSRQAKCGNYVTGSLLTSQLVNPDLWGSPTSNGSHLPDYEQLGS